MGPQIQHILQHFRAQHLREINPSTRTNTSHRSGRPPLRARSYVPGLLASLRTERSDATRGSWPCYERSKRTRTVAVAKGRVFLRLFGLQNLSSEDHWLPVPAPLAFVTTSAPETNAIQSRGAAAAVGTGRPNKNQHSVEEAYTYRPAQLATLGE